MRAEFPLLLQLSFTTPPTSLPLLNPNNFSYFNSRPTGGPRNRCCKASARFNLHDEDLFSEEFGFGGATKRRAWWSDGGDDDDDVEDDWDAGDEGNEFSIFKIIRAAGWMLPAIAITLLLGNGTNAFLMALAVPLGQTALSLVFDKVWGSTSMGQKSRYKAKTRRKPFSAYAKTTQTSAKKEQTKTGEARGSYQSWVGADDVSYKKGDKRAPKFGGWDELDSETSSAKTNRPPKQQNKGKLSRTGRVRDKPLLLRLLIAVFPFLGYWTKFLF